MRKESKPGQVKVPTITKTKPPESGLRPGSYLYKKRVNEA